MNRGDLYDLGSLYALQIGNLLFGNVGLLLAVRESLVQNVPGCDPKEPLYLVRSSVKTYSYDITVITWRVQLRAPDQLAMYAKVAEFSGTVMDDIEKCAIKHKKIPKNILPYFK